MGFRDGFYTPKTAQAILSWRILLGIGVTALAIFLGLNPVLSVVFGAATYGASVVAAMPRNQRTRIDPFTVQEPWRQFVQSAQGLDPTALRSRLDTLHQQDDADASIASVESQLASVDRLKEQSTRTSNRLRLAQTRVDELVARAAEVSIGAGDTDAYEHDVEDLVDELEGLRLAVEETRTA